MAEPAIKPLTLEDFLLWEDGTDTLWLPMPELYEGIELKFHIAS